MDTECIYCKNQHTMNCPNSKYCYNIKNKPYFVLKSEYKSKLICKDKVFYNIHHFNKFYKILARIFWKIKIEDV